MNRQEYAKRLSDLTRADLLKLCRAGGFSAGKLATNEELIDVLYTAFGSRAK